MKRILDNLNIGVILLVLGTLFSLTFPVFVTKLTGDLASSSFMVKGYTLFSFSPWGYVVVFVPVSLLAMMWFHDKMPHKYPLTLLLVFLGLFGHNACVLAAREWIYGVANSFVRAMGQMLYYPMFLVAAAFMLMLHMYDEDCLLDDDFLEDDFIDDDQWDGMREKDPSDKAA